MKIAKTSESQQNPESSFTISRPRLHTRTARTPPLGDSTPDYPATPEQIIPAKDRQLRARRAGGSEIKRQRGGVIAERKKRPVDRGNGERE